MFTIFGKFAVVFCLVLCAVPITIAQARQGESRTAGIVADYMVARVNGQLVTYSDVVWQLALQPTTPIEPLRTDDLNRALKLIIDQRLILQEAEKLPNVHGEEKEVEAALAELVRQFPSQEELRRRMTRVGLTSERLREIVHDRVDIDKYVDFRFRSFTVVSQKEVESYYRGVYVPRFRARAPGSIIPALETARVEIERTLTEEKIESSIQEFLDELRQRAEIVILRPIQP